MLPPPAAAPTAASAASSTPSPPAPPALSAVPRSAARNPVPARSALPAAPRRSEGRAVGAFEWPRVDLPDVALVARAVIHLVLRWPTVHPGCPAALHRPLRPLRSRWVDTPFPDRLRVVVIASALREQEHVLVRASRPVPHTLRHRVSLAPHNVAPHVPTVFLQRDRHPVRHEEQVFRF